VIRVAIIGSSFWWFLQLSIGNGDVPVRLGTRSDIFSQAATVIAIGDLATFWIAFQPVDEIAGAAWMFAERGG